MRKPYSTAILASVGILILILDTKTALTGASDGIALCIQTVVPSLFPFFILSTLLTYSLNGRRIPFLTPLRRLLRIPAGSESIWLVGILGGYPVGAQCTSEAVKSGYISRENGRRMLAFCSNAGPAFIFGIGSRIFSKTWMCWVLWAIHILSALSVGILTPGGLDSSAPLAPKERLHLTDALERSIRVMAIVCGWVIIFRVILAFCQRWFLWGVPQWAQCMFCGLLELANGCCGLVLISNEELRFVLFSVFLALGGLCVTMQTFSVCDGIDTSMYLPGKLTQGMISGLLSAIFISRETESILLFLALLAAVCGVYYFCGRKRQKILALQRNPLYNKENLHMR